MRKLLEDCCKELNISISDKQIERFFIYKELLLAWNKKINLTAITEERDIILKHFVDCITINANIDLKNKKIIDIGTGAGFPGLPIKIVQESINLTLMDSLNKRINFLKTVVQELELKDVLCIHSRAEDGGQNIQFRERFDICVSRAVANLSVLSEYSLPFVNVGGYFIALKGPMVNDEIEQAKGIINTLGGEIENIKNVNIPYTELNHNIVFIKKVKQTPTKYPRKSSKIPKNDIK